jgi:hypothetical protein
VLRLSATLMLFLNSCMKAKVGLNYSLIMPEYLKWYDIPNK